MGFPHEAVAKSAQQPTITLNAEIALHLLDGSLQIEHRRNIEFRARRKLIESNAYLEGWKAGNVMGSGEWKKAADQYKKEKMKLLYEEFPEFK